MSNKPDICVDNNSKRELIVRVISGFRDKVWSERFGAVFEYIRERGKVLRFVLDLTSCRWADPLPLLSALIAFNEAGASGIACEVRLPIRKDPEAKRFCHFLAQEGFLGLLREMDVEIRGEPADAIAEGHAGPSLLSSQCIPFQVFEAPAGDDHLEYSRQKIETLLEGAETQLQGQVPRWARADVVYRLRLFLQETLTNILEHAYPDQTSGRWAGLYVRYRAGRSGLPQSERKKWEDLQNLEREHCPKIKHQYLEGRVGCLEAFVLDSGIGMVESFSRAGEKVFGKYPFAQFFKEVLEDGKTSKPLKGRPTVAGGLQVVHDFLETHHDILRGFDNNTWVGIQTGNWDDFSQHIKVEPPIRIPGIAWTARLSWREKTDQGDEWEKWQGSEEHPVLCVLRTDEPSVGKGFESWPLYDRRFSDSWDRVPEVAPDQGYCLWLVSPGRLKNDVLKVAGKIAGKLPDTDGWTLWIADIPVHEAGIYLAAFEGFNREGSGNGWAKSIDRIVLVTTHWSVVVLDHRSHEEEKDAHGFVSSPLVARDLLNAGNGEGIRMLAVWLRWHDTTRLWSRIHKHRDDLTYLPQVVGWRKDESEKGHNLELDGYLDFTQTLADPQCLYIYLLAVRRLLGLFPGKFPFLSPLDDLTHSLSERFNADELEPTRADDKETNELPIGSIMVTGETSRRAEKRSLPSIHFFIHPVRGFEGHEDTRHEARLFLWRPKQVVFPTDTVFKKFARLGKSPLVAPGGRGYFVIPRFDYKGQSLAERTPVESYADWQEGPEVLLRSGHWCYENHHDFLTINLYLAVSRAFLSHGPLAAFLVQEFFQALGIKDDRKLSGKGKSWWKEIAGKISDQRDGLIVYPSHPNTVMVVAKILECFQPEYQNEINCRIIPFILLRRHQEGAAMLISPLSLERIRLSLKKLQADTVMLFDDAAITGKSFREMKAFVADLGAKVSKVVFILNRIRLPALRQHIPKQSYFWRFDIPIMGGGRTCPLCRALVMARDLDARLTSNSARERIQVWCANWQRTSPTSDWSIERGLYPLSLDQRITKKFGLRPDDMGNESPHLIHLDRSPAVAAYNSELRAMTGLDDNALVFAIKYKEKKQPLSWNVQIELFASQLLLFGHEVETGTISRILVALLAAAFEAPDTDDSTALAALVCLVVSDERLDLESMIDKAMKLADQQSDSLNLDMRIIIAALIDRGSLDGTKFLAPRRLLSASGLPLADRYRLLYEETEGSLGAAHSTPLPRWANPDNVVDCRKRRLDALVVRPISPALYFGNTKSSYIEL